MAVALAAAATDEQMEEAVAAVVRDRFAETTAKSRASWLRTWLILHAAASGVGTPPFPLTPIIIYGIAVLFKAGKYHSFANYMFRAKAEHMSLEGAEGDLDQAASRRGQGVNPIGTSWTRGTPPIEADRCVGCCRTRSPPGIR